MGATFAILMPSLEMILILLFAASIPTGFMLWSHWWLDSQRDHHPDDEIREQAKADAEHRAQHGQGGHGHGHGSGHADKHGDHHHHAHA